MDRVNVTVMQSSLLPTRPMAAGVGGHCLCYVLVGMLLGLMPLNSRGEAADGGQFSTLDQQVRELKKEVLAINRELLQLEQQLLYPKPKQLVVFVSVDKQAAVTLSSLQIELDGKILTRHRYNDSQNSALAEGGIHRPYLGTVENGEHRIAVSVAYYQRDGQLIEQSRVRTLAKRGQPNYLELRIGASTFAKNPEVGLHEW